MLCEDVAAQGWDVGLYQIEYSPKTGLRQDRRTAHTARVLSICILHSPTSAFDSCQPTKTLSPVGPAFFLGAYLSISFLPGLLFLNLLLALLKPLA